MLQIFEAVKPNICVGFQLIYPLLELGQLNENKVATRLYAVFAYKNTSFFAKNNFATANFCFLKNLSHSITSDYRNCSIL
jgi:hypothetical protein